MATLRVSKNGDYTVISNAALRDPRLSCKACGLLVRMLSLPDGWNFTIRGLASMYKDGKAAVDTALKELEETGYLRRERTRDASGHLSNVEYTIMEVADRGIDGPDKCASDAEESAPESDEPECVEASLEALPCPENQDVGAPPRPDFPDPDFPDPENRAQLNTITSKYLKIKPPIAPRAVTDRLIKAAAGDLELTEALLAFAERRAKSKHPISTDRSVTLLLNRLSKLSGGRKAEAIRLLEEATVCGWSSVYPIKGAASPAHRQVVERENIAQW